MISILDSFSLKGKVALVTGASYGIGMAVAAAYAGAGTTIVFSDLRPVLVFSGGGTLEARMEKSVLPHVFSFEKSAFRGLSSESSTRTNPTPPRFRR